MRILKSHYFISIHNFWGFLAVLMSFLFALCLSILPIPLWMNHLWPFWPVLMLIFWAAYLPKVVSPWLVWFIGLLDDVMQGSLLGRTCSGVYSGLFFSL
jgi:rod shape-determining protein MreD